MVPALAPYSVRSGFFASSSKLPDPIARVNQPGGEIQHYFDGKRQIWSLDQFPVIFFFTNKCTFKREEVGVFLSDTFGIISLNICNCFSFPILHERIDENELDAILE